MIDPSHAWDVTFGIGAEARALTAGQVAARALLVYFATLTIVRMGKKRFLSRASAFDVIVVIFIGSIASRAATGNAPLVPALAGAAAVVAIHWLLSALALRWHAFGRIIKGGPRLLVRNGIVDEAALRAEHMTHHDLEENLRDKGVATTDDVGEAWIERSGSVSVIKTKGGG